MISLLCPTRGRPQRLAQMIQCVKLTSDVKQIELCLYIDDDDLTYDGKMDEAFAGLPNLQVIRGERTCHSDYWNILAKTAKGELFMMMGDDVAMRTNGWDAMVQTFFASKDDPFWLVFGDDGCPNGKTFATHPIVHRRWYEVVGYFSGPGFSGDFADAWPQDLADMIQRKVYLPFYSEHLHPVWGKADFDQTYKETSQRRAKDKTQELYVKRLPERIADSKKLGFAIADFYTRWLPIPDAPVQD